MEKFYQFDNSVDKFEARKKNVEFFRSKTGLESIPPRQCYLTLCGLQSDEPTSEINQLVNMGLIKKTQYYGVDRGRRTIRDNRKTHPTAKWFLGEWRDIISTRNFRPAIIYLDTINFVGAETVIELTEQTMYFCPVGTFLFINVMLNNPHSGKSGAIYDEEEFIKKLNDALTVDYGEDFHSFSRCFVYYSETHLTKMCTYIFRRVK